jgi:hypothetical protein
MGTVSDFNAGMVPHNRAAMRSLGSTGQLPQDPFWGAMRVRHDANSARFQAGRPVMGALLGRDLAQRMGEADGRTSLFPDTPLWAHLRGRHDAHTARFDRYHPFLGKLFEIELPRESSAGAPTSGPAFGTDAPGQASSLTPSDVPIASGAPLFDLPIARVESPTNSREGPHPAVAPVPEPSGITLAGLGLILVVLAGARSWWLAPAKQVRRIILTRGSLVTLLWSGGDRDESVEAHVLATPSPPSATQGHLRRPRVPEDAGRAGTRSRPLRC